MEKKSYARDIYGNIYVVKNSFGFCKKTRFSLYDKLFNLTIIKEGETIRQLVRDGDIVGYDRNGIHYIKEVRLGAGNQCRLPLNELYVKDDGNYRLVAKKIKNKWKLYFMEN